MRVPIIGDEVEVIQRYAGAIEGLPPEVYEEGERYTVHRVVNLPASRTGKGNTESLQGVTLREDARFYLPFRTNMLFLGTSE
ncbi:MAG TPA: hypothetical protein VGI33_04480 [Paenibacillus sp.]|jgi:hypothetical protein